MKRKELTRVCAVLMTAVMISGPVMPVCASETEVTVSNEETENSDSEEEIPENYFDDSTEIQTEESEEQEDILAASGAGSETFTDSENAGAAEDSQEETYRDVTEDMGETGVTGVEGQLVQGSNRGRFVTGELTNEIVSRRTMDGKQQTWRVIHLDFSMDDLKMDKGHAVMQGALKFTTEDKDTPIEKQMTVGNCYYLRDVDTVTNSRYISSSETWEPTFGGATLMYGETTKTVSTEYYCIYKNNGKIIRYLIQIKRKGCTGLECEPYYSQDNPASVNWVLDEDTGIYMADIRELDAAVSRNQVIKYDENGLAHGSLSWNSIVSTDPSSDIYRDEEYLYVKKAGQYNIYKASWGDKEYDLPVRFTYDIYENAPDALARLKTDGVTDFSSMESAGEFSRLFPEKYQQKAGEYFTQVMALQKVLDNTRTGSYKGDWDYRITGVSYSTGAIKPWTDECESHKVDVLKEQYHDVWDNIFGLKDAGQKILEYTDPEKALEGKAEKLSELRDSYLKELESAYQREIIQSCKDVQDIVDGAQKETEVYRKKEAVETPVPQKPVLKASVTSYTRKEGDKAFNLKVSVTGKATISYKSSNKNVATVDSRGKVTVKGPGETLITVTARIPDQKSQSVKIKITVKPSSKLGVKAVPQKGRKIQITWKRSKKADGYQIIVSTDKSFKKTVKTVYINKNQTTRTTVKNLKSGKTYYVRIRSYKKITDGRIYSDWKKTGRIKARK